MINQTDLKVKTSPLFLRFSYVINHLEFPSLKNIALQMNFTWQNVYWWKNLSFLPEKHAHALYQTPDSVQFSSVAQSCQTLCHTVNRSTPGLPVHQTTPAVHSDLRPSSQWCYPAISSSVVPFSCPQSLPVSESFPMSQFFTWGGQSTGVSASASFPPKKSQGWSTSEWTGWISLQSTPDCPHLNLELPDLQHSEQ